VANTIETLTREMAITHKEFYRLINKTIRNVAELKVNVDTSTVHFPYADGEVLIKLGNQSSRKIGSLSLPKTRINFEFHNLTRTETTRYVQKFDLTFRRGGG